ncbi:MAG TPA: metallophosphoesterase family protein [Micromonospora sp.]
MRISRWLRRDSRRSNNAARATAAGRPLYVVSDIHGHRAELRRALRQAGLVDDAYRWSGGEARLWFLGDYVDRGPDGIGVIDDIRRLTEEAAAAGGEVRALLGNHEALFLGAHRFAAEPVDGWHEPQGFRGGWLRYGGRLHDMQRLTPTHVEWLLSLPAVARVDDYLLLHADTTRYLELGATVADINASVAATMASADSAKWFALFRLLSHRGDFRASHPAVPDSPASTMLKTLGGTVIVHGHSTLPRSFGIPVAAVRGPLRYADGKVIAIDGGVYLGGPLLLTRLA